MASDRPIWSTQEPPYRLTAADVAGMVAFGAMVVVAVCWLREWLELVIRFGTWVQNALWGPL